MTRYMDVSEISPCFPRRAQRSCTLNSAALILRHLAQHSPGRPERGIEMFSIPFRGREALSITTDNLTIGSTAMVVLDSNGDVIFVLGTDKNTKLRVSSKVLSIASKPFAAMFSPRFTESSGLSAAAPKEIPLPEDDAKAMTVLCKVIHHKVEDGDEPATTLELLEVVVLADKYDCTKLHSLKLWTRDLRCSLPKDAFPLLVISYLSNNSKRFAAASMSLVCCQEPAEPFMDWEKEFGANCLPETIWCKASTSLERAESNFNCDIVLLEEKRHHIAHDIILLPLRLIFPMYPACQAYSWSTVSRTTIQEHDLASQALWNTLEGHWLNVTKSINDLLEELHWVMSKFSDTPAQLGTGLIDNVVDIKTAVRTVLKEVAQERGLCIACVKAVVAGGDNCIAHTD